MKRKQALLSIFMLFTLVSCDAQSSKRQAYIERYKLIAVSEMQRSGIPASIKLAQGILESGDGNSTLAVKANNHFGMKCGAAWKGKTYYIKDDDRDANGNLIKSCFRVFSTPEESYYAHTEFLMDPRKAYRYGPLFEFKNTDYKKWAKGLKKAGYATNPKYPDLLIGIIEANDLHKYDYMTVEQIDPNYTGPTETPEIPLSNKKFFYHNDVKVVYAKVGDTPESIGKRLDIPASRIANYNEISADTEIKENAVVYLQPKRRRSRGKQDYHIVKKGETMYSISQLYGIKERHLYRKNRMKKGTQPVVGEKIAVRRRVKKHMIPKVIGGTTTNPTNEPEEIDFEGEKVIHVVQKGDTLYGIARKYNTSVDAIKKLNNMKNNELDVGQELRVK